MEFLNSNCELVLLIIDSTYCTIYCKGANLLNQLYKNAQQHKFKSVAYVTDKNDCRSRLSVW
ncbi:DUF2691 family protein [Priestia megaterium]|nr:DUF2691 family protein [Priestia megaterium]